MNRIELLNALEIVRPGLSSGDDIQQGRWFMFKDGYVITSDSLISIRHPIEDVGFEGSIDGDKFYKLISKIKKDEIEIETNGDEIKVKSGRTRAGFVLKEIQFHLDEIEDFGNWRKLPKDFKTAIKFTMFSCGKESGKPAFTCIFVNKNGKIMSTDDHRVTIYNIGKLPVKSFLLPRSSAKELVKYDFTEISKSTSWVHFRNNAGTIFSCRVYSDTNRFKGLDEVLDVDGIEIGLPIKTTEILEKAMIFTERDKNDIIDEEIDVTFKNGTAIFNAQNRKDNSWFSEQARMDYSGDEATLVVNPRFLKDMIELGMGDDKEKNKKALKSITIGSNSRKISSMLFKGECWTHYAMLKVCNI